MVINAQDLELTRAGDASDFMVAIHCHLFPLAS
jgi:hypothetical protein